MPDIPMPRVQMPGTEMPSAREITNYDLKKGTYGVSVSVGRSFQSRLDEGASEIGQILQSNPGLLPLIGPLYFKYRDFPGSVEISELLKKERNHSMPYLDDSDGDNTDAMQSHIQQLEQQGQQLQEELGKATEYIKTDQAKWAAQAAIAQGKADLQVHLQSMKDANALSVEEIRAIAKGAVLEGKGSQEQMILDMKQRHARDISSAHILSSQHAEAMKAAHAKELEAVKVEGSIVKDKAAAEIDIIRDREEHPQTEVVVDVELPLDGATPISIDPERF
jgi:hypothetical protein